MEKDGTLHHKISKLQLRILDFHNRISPTKGESGKRAVESASQQRYQDPPATECPEDNPPKLFSILKPFICILGPFLFPTLVYSIEGSCPLFWVSTAVSSFITFFLLLMAFSFLSYKMHEVIRNSCKMLRGVQTKVKIVVQDVDYMGSRRKQLCTLALLILLIFASAYWALLNDIPTMLSICLIVGNYLAGILTVLVYQFLKQPKHLPYVSPLTMKKKLQKVANPSSKRGLDFYEMPLKSSSLLNPQECYRSHPEASTNAKFQPMVSTQTRLPSH